MNKLAIYRNNYWNEYLEKEESFGIEHDEAFEKGFNIAIELNLAIKFTEWLAINGIKVDGKNDKGEITWMKYVGASHTNQGTTKDLYKYWIENIFKIE